MKKQYLLLLASVMLLVSVAFAEKTVRKAFTLSDADLMSLDWYLDYCAPDDPNAARITAKRDVAGPGVEFDVHFPGKNKSNCRSRLVEYVSCDRGGESTLVGIDVNDYKMFALKFTLVAVDGNSSPDAGGLLGVGALINGRHSGPIYSTNIISFMQEHETSVVSSIPVYIEKISVIGIAVYQADTMGWNPAGTTVTVQVEAAPNAEIPP
jgi:hypothetical protein